MGRSPFDDEDDDDNDDGWELRASPRPGARLVRSV